MSAAAPVSAARPSCFHCGLPVPGGAPWRGVVLGEARDFCCAGCQAIAETIAEDGLGEYYRLRTETAPRPAEREGASDEDAFADGALAPAWDGALREATLYVEGARCPACLWLNESRLRALGGVASAEATWAAQTVRVRWDPARVGLGQILAAVRRIGYRARPVDPAHRRELGAEANGRDATRLIFAGFVGMMIMNLAVAAYLAGGPDASGRLALWETYARWSCLAAALVLLLYPGREFFAGAARDVRHGRAGMDVPIAIGLAGAFAASAAATVRGAGPVYFDAIGMLVPAVLLARAFEARAREKAAAGLDRYAAVSAPFARRVDAGGNETRVPASALAPGDHVRVLPDEAVPADGVLLAAADLDEAVLTGEPWPRRRAAGETVAAGSVPRDRPAAMRVTAAAGDSTLEQIRRLVERGLANRPPYVQLADRAAAVLVAAVLAAAAATLAWRLSVAPSTALPATIAVLIVTCPCALALAAPVALAITAGRLTSIGVLSTRAGALERLAAADLAVFDKTGTLTTGTAAVERVETFGGLDEARARRIAAALESVSEHPAARAIAAAHAGEPALAVRAAEAAGAGVEGEVGGEAWRIGTPEFAAAAAALPAEAAAAIGRADGDGLLPVLLADRRGRGAVFGLAERWREGADGIAAALRREGVRRAALLSGDSTRRAERLARALGFDEARGGMSGDDKLAWVRESEGAGGRILYVGDGWNDAPALAAASVSVSFAEAPRVPRASSDFLLLGRGLGTLAEARRIARRARRVLAQNVVWALGYNLLAVPLAAAGRVPPWAAALGMSASSLLVIVNALRLGRQKNPSPQ
jgi:Cu2+-exporting ATPase